ncbi:hypothetical protein [Pseudomonas sp. MRSN 12121]|uniref:hypothetical protein n=1 Tax=Pseudomonas sp. MRSN 12121 TaxID=1611770 RepID=UPI0005BEAE49|nr:hypothetical protein [Pseudomonas sp. MRSN 12121]AJO77772.1 hypothetical protein TO66_10860 [Pseudomonas sp. MRSN 12121]
MHPAMQARIDGNIALHIRATAATAEFYAMIGKEAPASKVRFQVVTKGSNAYHVIERSTGKVKGFRFSWKAAINLAQELESRADGAKVDIEGRVK